MKCVWLISSLIYRIYRRPASSGEDLLDPIDYIRKIGYIGALGSLKSLTEDVVEKHRGIKYVSTNHMQNNNVTYNIASVNAYLYKLKK